MRYKLFILLIYKIILYVFYGKLEFQYRYDLLILF